MKSKHPEQKERLAVCYSMYKQYRKKSTSKWISNSLGIDNESKEKI